MSRVKNRKVIMLYLCFSPCSFFVYTEWPNRAFAYAVLHFLAVDVKQLE